MTTIFELQEEVEKLRLRLKVTTLSEKATEYLALELDLLETKLCALKNKNTNSNEN